jgi:polysaccharide biosynthesis transport protein
MTLKHFIAILRARWVIACSALVLVFITALVVSLLLPSRYTAAGKILIDPRSADPVNGMMFNGQVTPSYIGTQVDVLTSERVARRVIRLTRLDESPQFRAQWVEASKGQGDFQAWAADLMSQNLSVRQTRDSNVVELSYQAADPQFAALVANAFMQAYIDITLEMRVEPAKRYAQMFSEQSKELREKLEQAQSRLSMFQQEKKLMATDERLDIENARLSDLSNQLVMMQAAAFDSASRTAQAAESGDRIQEVLNHPVVVTLKSEIARAEGNLKEMQARFGDAYPQVQEARANVNELRARLDAEIRRVTSSVGLNNRVNKSREVQIRASLEAQRQKVLALKAVRDEASVLSKDVENAQRAYDSLIAKLNQTALETQANQTNISVLQQASPPLKASFPKLWVNLALALILGSLLAGGTAFALEMADPRLRTTEPVLGLRVLANIPDGAALPAPVGPVKLQFESSSQKLITNA